MSNLSVVTGRARAAALLATAVLVFSSLGSCSARDPSEARATVERFVAALYAGDRETVAQLAPGLGEEEVLEQVFSALTEFPTWSIIEVIRRGNRARARINFSADGQEREVVVPLSLAHGKWTVDSRVSVTTKLEFLPLKQ